LAGGSALPHGPWPAHEDESPFIGRACHRRGRPVAAVGRRNEVESAC